MRAFTVLGKPQAACTPRVEEQRVRDARGGKESRCGARQLGSGAGHREPEARAFHHLQTGLCAKCTLPHVYVGKVQQFHVIEGCPTHRVSSLEKLRPVGQSSN